MNDVVFLTVAADTRLARLLLEALAPLVLADEISADDVRRIVSSAVRVVSVADEC